MKEKRKAFWHFIIEYEVISIPLFTLLAIFSYDFINKMFFAVDDQFKQSPTLEVFYYAIFTLVIWLGFWLVVWVWVKWNFPEIAKAIKTPTAAPYEVIINYEKAFYFLIAVFSTLVATAWVVFP